jgi:hypothetical protein
MIPASIATAMVLPASMVSRPMSLQSQVSRPIASRSLISQFAPNAQAVSYSMQETISLPSAACQVFEH